MVISGFTMSSRLSLATVLLLAVLGSAQADSGPTDLWSLYLREHSASLCGRVLSEEQETELDEAQHLARLGSQLRKQRFSITAQGPSPSRRATHCAAAECPRVRGHHLRGSRFLPRR